MVTMGFYEHNSLGKFNAEIKADLPSFGAEHLTGRPGSSGELDFKADEAADITNYDSNVFKKFIFDDSEDVAGDGVITSLSDKGFHFAIEEDAPLDSQPITISKDTNTYTWDLSPGDQLSWSHVGGGTNSNTEVTLEKSDGTEVKTDLPWMITDSSGSQTTGSFDPQQKYQIALGLPVASATGDGTGETANEVTTKETNWPVLGVGLAALVGVGLLLAKRN